VIDGPWTGVHCEGDAPLLCVRRNGAPAGAVELLIHPDTHPPETQPIPYLTRILADYEKGVAADRQVTCANSGVFAARPVQEVAINGGGGMKSDWSVTNSAGVVIERQITYFFSGRTTIANLSATALVPGKACIEALGSEFTPATMAEEMPILDRIAARGQFSAG
jgi:hypothetical protein